MTMVIQTPPRTSTTMLRKRNRPTYDIAAANTGPLIFSTEDDDCDDDSGSVAGCSSHCRNPPGSGCGRGNGGLFSSFSLVSSFSNHNDSNNDTAAWAFATAADVATCVAVSPIQLEVGASPLLSQSSTTSSLSFASFAATDPSSMRMNHESMRGATSTDDGVTGDGVSGSVVEGVGPSYINSFSQNSDGHNSVSMDSLVWNSSMRCAHFDGPLCPPAKRARFINQTSCVTRNTVDDEMMAPPSIVTLCAKINKMHTEKSQNGWSCCHVCHASMDSPEPSAACNKNFNAPGSQVHAGATPAHGAKYPSTSCTTTKSHSLLSYFGKDGRSHDAFAKQQGQFTLIASQQHHPQQRHLQTHLQNQSPYSHVHRGNETSLSPCRYCDKPTCLACSRKCEICQSSFCTFCSKVDYGGVVERILCFECDEVESRACGDANKRSGDSEDWDCDMMDL